jgi:predicted HTH transcriptional regulator
MIDLITILLLTGVTVFLYIENRRLKQDTARIEKEDAERVNCAIQSSGLDDYNARLQEIKEERKAKILEFLKEVGSLSSGDIAEMLEVSRSTALRDLNELEEEGRLTQKGTLGRFVRYKINASYTD